MNELWLATTSQSLEEKHTEGDHYSTLENHNLCLTRRRRTSTRTTSMRAVAERESVDTNDRRLMKHENVLRCRDQSTSVLHSEKPTHLSDPRSEVETKTEQKNLLANDTEQDLVARTMVEKQRRKELAKTQSPRTRPKEKGRKAWTSGIDYHLRSRIGIGICGS